MYYFYNKNSANHYIMFLHRNVMWKDNFSLFDLFLSVSISKTNFHLKY